MTRNFWTRPRPHLCLDKGYDNPAGHATVAKHEYVPHIRRIGEDATARKHKKSKPRRWVVERTLDWLSKCRALLVRYDKNWLIISDSFNSPLPCCGIDAITDSVPVERLLR